MRSAVLIGAAAFATAGLAEAFAATGFPSDGARAAAGFVGLGFAVVGFAIAALLVGRENAAATRAAAGFFLTSVPPFEPGAAVFAFVAGAFRAWLLDLALTGFADRTLLCDLLF